MTRKNRKKKSLCETEKKSSKNLLETTRTKKDHMTSRSIHPQVTQRSQTNKQESHLQPPPPPKKYLDLIKKKIKHRPINSRSRHGQVTREPYGVNLGRGVRWCA